MYITMSKRSLTLLLLTLHLLAKSTDARRLLVDLNEPTYRYLLDTSTNLVDGGNKLYSMKYQNSSTTLRNGPDSVVYPTQVITGPISLDYKIKFPADWLWSTGGKLPGLFSGSGDCTAAVAGRSCWSVQLGWASKGVANIVLQVPQAAAASLPGAVINEAVKIPLPLNWTKEGWSNIQLIVDLNRIGYADGYLQVKINDTLVADIDGVTFREAYGLDTDGILFEAGYTSYVPASYDSARYIDLFGFELFRAQQALPPPSPPPPSPPSPPPPTPPAPPFVFTELGYTQRRRAMSLTSIFENSNTTLQYTYCEDIKDGRGYTFGFAGFTTRTGDGYNLVKAYTAKNASNLLVPYLPELQALAYKGNSSTKGLVGFCEAVNASGADPAWKSTQDLLTNQYYYWPAMKWANKTGVKHAITKGQIYDAVVQHGLGLGDWFSADYIFRAANNMTGGSPLQGVDEVTWLRNFMIARTAMVIKDAGGDRSAAKRIQLYTKLLDTGNLELSGPIYVDRLQHADGWTITDIYYGQFQIYVAKDHVLTKL